MGATKSLLSVMELEVARLGRTLHESWFLAVNNEREIQLMRRLSTTSAEPISEAMERLDFVLWLDGLKKGMEVFG